MCDFHISRYGFTVKGDSGSGNQMVCGLTVYSESDPLCFESDISLGLELNEMYIVRAHFENVAGQSPTATAQFCEF